MPTFHQVLSVYTLFASKQSAIALFLVCCCRSILEMRRLVSAYRIDDQTTTCRVFGEGFAMCGTVGKPGYQTPLEMVYPILWFPGWTAISPVKPLDQEEGLVLTAKRVNHAP